MKNLIKFLAFPLLFVLVYFCNGPIEDKETTSSNVNVSNQKLKNCNGKQSYFSYTISGTKQEIHQEIMQASTIYSDATEASRISDYHIVWKNDNTMGDFMLLSGGDNFKVGSIPFPTNLEKQEVRLKIDKNDGQGIAYLSTTGTLEIEAFNYIHKGRKSRETRDFIKGTYTGTFKNAFDFLGDEKVYHIDIDFCLCGTLGI